MMFGPGQQKSDNSFNCLNSLLCPLYRNVSGKTISGRFWAQENINAMHCFAQSGWKGVAGVKLRPHPSLCCTVGLFDL
jgi:hypothetical protein